MPRRFSRFGAVVRIRFGDSLAPAFVALAFEAHEQKTAIVGSAEARFEETHQRQAAQSQARVDRCARESQTRYHAYFILRRAKRPAATISVSFRYIAIEGPIGVGKTRLAQRLASRIDGTTLLEDDDNPFLADFYNERPGAALQAQFFYLLNRHRQLM